MRQRVRRWTLILAGAACLAGVSAWARAQEPAQEPAAQWQESPPGQSSPLQAPALTAAQLDQLTAPVALYPDPLLGMILTAATYPLEIVEASRWLDEGDHAALTGEALNEALAQRDWDTSVKALVSVPEVLRLMQRNLEWTARLGDAFLAHQAEVMDSVQRLRQRAAASGELRSSPQESVSSEDGAIVITPTRAEVIYVPCYRPVIYGPWPWPAHPPLYFPYPPGYCYGGGFITFSTGFGILRPYWGWGRWSWRGHGFYVVRPRRAHHGSMRVRPWFHNPAHRRGIPYRDGATARRYPPASAPGGRAHAATPARGAQLPRTQPARPNVPQSRSHAPRRAPMQLQTPPHPPRLLRHGLPPSRAYGPAPSAPARNAARSNTRPTPARRGGALRSARAGHHGRPPR